MNRRIRHFILHPSGLILDLGALLFLVAGPFILFGRLLLSGRTLYYRDITLDFEPQTTFIVRALHQGEFPLWNPLSGAGYPQMAGMQPPYFYPPTILFYYMDFPKALSLYLLLHMVLAGCATYALTRWWSWSRPSAALTGLLFMFSGVFLSLSEFYPSFPPAALLPLVVLQFERSLQRAGTIPLLAATAAFALLISNGRPDLVLMTTLFLLTYAAFLLVRRTPAVGLLRLLKVLAVMTVGATLLNGIMLVPAVELLRHSTRLHGIPIGEAGAHALSPFHLLTLLVPDFFGNPEWGHDWGRFLLGEPNQHYSQLYLTLYPGMATWLLAIAAWRSRNPLLIYLALLAVAALIVSAGTRTPIFGYVQLLPLFKWTRHAIKYFFLVTWCWILMAGLGCEVLLHRPRHLQGLVRAGMLASLAGAVILGLAAWQAQPAAAWAAGLDFARWVPPDPSGVASPARINAFMAQAVATFYWLIWVRCFQTWLTAAAMMFLISLWTAQVVGRGTFVALLLLLALGDAGSANGRLLFSTEADVFRDRPPLVDFLTADGGRRTAEGKGEREYRRQIGGRMNQTQVSARSKNKPGRAGPPAALADQIPSAVRRPPSANFRILHVAASAQLAAANAAYLLQHDTGRSLQDKLHRQAREILDNNIPLHHGLATASMYASLVPFLAPQYLWRALATANRPAIDPRQVPERRALLEGMMGIKYRVTERAGSEAPVVPAGYEFAWDAPLATNPEVRVTVLRNRYYLPRAHFVTSAQVVPSLGSAAFHLVSAARHFGRGVVLVDDQALKETMRLREYARHSLPGMRTICRTIDAGLNRVSVFNESPESGFLVLSDVYYPGWRATVDGEYRPILNANALFRAVYVDAGRHTVEFRYDPASFKQGIAVSMLATAGLLWFGTHSLGRRAWFLGRSS